MKENPGKENARLQPLIEWVIEAKRNPPPEFQKELDSAHAKSGSGKANTKSGDMQSIYESAVIDFISKNASIPEVERKFFLRRMRKECAGDWSDEDYEMTLELTDALLGAAFAAEVEYYGGPKAIAKMKKTVPGLSEKLYEKLLDWMQYINR